MKVAILDDYNHLAEQYVGPFRDQLDLVIFSDTILPTPDPAALISRLEPFDVICTMRERTPLPRAVLEKLPNLKILLTTGMANRGIDLDACKERDVKVAGTTGSRGSSNIEFPRRSDIQVAATVQHTWSLILALASNVPRDHALIPSGSWLNAMPLNLHLPGLTLGILGLGKLGLGTARIGRIGFGMKIIAWSQNLTQDAADKAAESVGLTAGDITAVTKDHLFENSDILSVHYILSDRSRGIVGKTDLDRMKPTSMIVNTSRGPLIDENALLDTLEQGKIRGAALDVFDTEPLPLDSRWRTVAWGKDGCSEVVYTPHTGYSYDTSIYGMWEQTRDNLGRIARGEEVQNRMV